MNAPRCFDLGLGPDRPGRFARRTPRGWLALSLSACAFLAASWGCSDKKPPVSTTTAEAVVSGTVRVKGKVAKKGKIHFDPSNYRRKNQPRRSAPIGKDGSYTITTLAGTNRVTVSGTPGVEYAQVELDLPPGPSRQNVNLPKP